MISPNICESSPLHPKHSPVLGYEAMRCQEPGLLGPVEEEDQVGDKLGFSQDDDAGNLVETWSENTQCFFWGFTSSMMAQLSMLSLAPGPCTALSIILTIIITFFIIFIVMMIFVILMTTPVKVAVDEKSRR